MSVKGKSTNDERPKMEEREKYTSRTNGGIRAMQARHPRALSPIAHRRIVPLIKLFLERGVITLNVKILGSRR